MSGNTFGTLFSVTSFGESHGPAIGCVVDGCPPGLALCEADIQGELDRRKPGTSRHVTQRREPDSVEILSGVFEGKTTGTPIGLLIRNQDQRSKDYGNIAETFRPGHADYTYNQKYGFRDYRGGGRSSARETAVRVAAGAIARKWLDERYGVSIHGWMSALGPIEIPFVSAADIDGNAMIFDAGAWGSSGITLYRNNGGFRFMLPGGMARGDCMFPRCQPRSWYHLVCVWTGAEMGLYVNGQLAARVPGEGPALSAEAASKYPARLGTLASGRDKQLYFRGIIDEVAIFRRALSEQEIQVLLQLGAQGQPLIKAARTRSGR